MNLIYENYNKKIDIDNLDMNDPNVYKLIGEGRTSGVFQLESSGMIQFMKELKTSLPRGCYSRYIPLQAGAYGSNSKIYKEQE